MTNQNSDFKPHQCSLGQISSNRFGWSTFTATFTLRWFVILWFMRAVRIYLNNTERLFLMVKVKNTPCPSRTAHGCLSFKLLTTCHGTDVRYSLTRWPDHTSHLQICEILFEVTCQRQHIHFFFLLRFCRVGDRWKMHSKGPRARIQNLHTWCARSTGWAISHPNTGDVLLQKRVFPVKADTRPWKAEQKQLLTGFLLWRRAERGLCMTYCMQIFTSCLYL